MNSANMSSLNCTARLNCRTQALKADILHKQRGTIRVKRANQSSQVPRADTGHALRAHYPPVCTMIRPRDIRQLDFKVTFFPIGSSPDGRRPAGCAALGAFFSKYTSFESEPPISTPSTAPISTPSAFQAKVSDRLRACANSNLPARPCPFAPATTPLLRRRLLRCSSAIVVADRVVIPRRARSQPFAGDTLPSPISRRPPPPPPLLCLPFNLCFIRWTKPLCSSLAGEHLCSQLSS